MAPIPDSALQTLQHEVQRLLGRCLLRLQQYESLIKALVAHHEISGPSHALEAVRATRIDGNARKTLGSLVGDLLGSYIVTNENGTPVEAANNSPEDVISFGMRMHLSLSDADFARTENELKELVLLRNNLVHHFIDQHDIWSLDGCRGAQDALVAAYNRIDQHTQQLREWAEDMQKCRRKIVELLQSGVVRDMMVNDGTPNGTVDWPAAGVVRALREAASELAIEGWAPVADAGRWIAERHPEQNHARYGCRSWRQVVHEARIFEIRYFEWDGQSSAWYRERKGTANSR